MSKLLLVILITLSLSAGEYDFDMSVVEPEPYEYSGYLRIDEKTQKLNNQDKAYQKTDHIEALFDFSYSAGGRKDVHGNLPH